MNLQSIELGKLTSNDIVSTADQISDYAESTFTHLSGDSNISGNVSVGDNCKSFLKKSFMCGVNLTVGTNSFQIRYIDVEKKRVYVNSSIPDEMMDKCVGKNFNGKLKANFTVGAITGWGIDESAPVAGFKKYFTTENVGSVAFNGKWIDDKTFQKPDGTNYVLNVHEGHYYDVNTGNTYIVILQKTSADDYSAYEPIELSTLTKVDYSRQDPTNYKINCPTDVELGDGTPQGYNSFAFGENSSAVARSSVALGRDNIAEKDYGTAVGRNNKAGYAAFAAGRNNSANGNDSIALGIGNTANGTDSIALGVGATTQSTHPYSFVWSSGGSYSTQKDRTFCINPNGGINGFYIGENTLDDFYVRKSDIKSCLSKIDLTNPSADKSIEAVWNALSELYKML